MSTVKRILDDLRQARVLVLHPRDEDGGTLVDHLKRLGCDVKAVWPPPPAISDDIDAIFVQVGDTGTEGLISLLEGTKPRSSPSSPMRARRRSRRSST